MQMEGAQVVVQILVERLAGSADLLLCPHNA